MEPTIAAIVAVWLVSVGAIVGAIAGRSHERKLWQKRLLERQSVDRGEPRRLTESIAPAHSTSAESKQLANAVDAIAVEVERIGEAQRFLTKLLAERDQRFSASKTPSPVPGSVRSPLPPTA